jgi:hypothetical protein
MPVIRRLPIVSAMASEPRVGPRQLLDLTIHALFKSWLSLFKVQCSSVQSQTRTGTWNAENHAARHKVAKPVQIVQAVQSLRSVQAV